MPEQVQIDLVVNTAQLDVAEARYDALKARQLGLQGGTAAPGLSVPGAMASSAVGAMMFKAATAQKVLTDRTALQVAQANALVTPEMATMFAWSQATQNYSDLGDVLGLDLKKGLMMQPAGAFAPGLEGQLVNSASDPRMQNVFARPMLAHQYFLSTGRHAPDTMSASEIFAQTQQFEADKAAFMRAAEAAKAGTGAGATASAAAAAAGGNTANKLWSKLRSKTVRVPGKTLTGTAAVLAFMALDGAIDNEMDDYEFRRAAGISLDDKTLVQHSTLAETAVDVSSAMTGTAARIMALSPGAAILSKKSMAERLANIKENQRLGGSGAIISEFFGGPGRGEANRAAKTISKAKADMIGQREWEEAFVAGLREIDNRADSIAQDFAQRVYGGGDIGRSEVVAWVKQSAVQYQKGKFAEEAWKQHPNARIAKDPPKE